MEAMSVQSEDRLNEVKKEVTRIIEGEGDLAERMVALTTFHKSQDLTLDEQREIYAWVMNNARGTKEIARRCFRELEGLTEITEHLRPGETLGEAFPQLPSHLQDIIRSLADRGILDGPTAEDDVA